MAYRKVVIAAVALCFTTVIACSSSGDKTVIFVPAEGGVPSETDSGPSCAVTATYIECLACCGGPNDAFVEAQNAFDNCRCDTCKECADTVCGTNPDSGAPSAACTTCLQSDATGQACFAKADAICRADKDCATFQVCTQGANCNDKPDDVDGG